jgi:heme a synthase
MPSQPYQPLVHRFAVATALMALVPIAVGAIVTTLDAGMAFRDWPSSDGHSMLAYPWLESAGHKFVEHGHRLAGMAIGLVCIAFVLVALVYEPRRWAKVACIDGLGRPDHKQVVDRAAG